jgi:hypothetical protein
MQKLPTKRKFAVTVMLIVWRRVLVFAAPTSGGGTGFVCETETQQQRITDAISEWFGLNIEYIL